MRNEKRKIKNKKCIPLAFLFAVCLVFSAHADALDQEFDEMSAEAVAGYELDGTVFQKITNLEQDKVLMQLEKEKAQLDLELDRLAAEKIKLHMEIDTLAGRAEEQQMALDTEKAKLEAEQAKLERDKQSFEASASAPDKKASAAPVKNAKEEHGDEPVGKKYSLVDIIGAGRQLQATIKDLANGQRKKVLAGKTVDGYTIKSISLDDGVVFQKDGKTETLNISREK